MSNRSLVLAALLLSGAAGAGEGISCHIHPPGSTPQNPVGIIGPFASPAACEQARADRFGSNGRCHCAADFSPRWVPPPVVPDRGASPLG